MEYNAIASLKVASARKSSSPDSIIFALPSMAAANTGKSLGVNGKGARDDSYALEVLVSSIARR